MTGPFCVGKQALETSIPPQKGSRAAYLMSQIRFTHKD
jgi:hypothetical protein